jgi:hypothetical protein
LDPSYRSHVKRFLWHLEQKGSSWSQLVPDKKDSRPLKLEERVNEGIAAHTVDSQTRTAINEAFGFAILSESNSRRVAGAQASQPAGSSSGQGPLASTSSRAVANLEDWSEVRGRGWNRGDLFTIVENGERIEVRVLRTRQRDDPLVETDFRRNLQGG